MSIGVSGVQEGGAASDREKTAVKGLHAGGRRTPASAPQLDSAQG
ncbi:MAG: hypothetical protein ACK557_23135 [Planctomycetota bacterium]